LGGYPGGLPGGFGGYSADLIQTQSYGINQNPRVVTLSPLAQQAVAIFQQLARLQTQNMAIERFQLARILKVILQLLQSNINAQIKAVLIIIIRLLCTAFDNEKMITEGQRAVLVRDALLLLAAIARSPNAPAVLVQIIIALINAIKNLFALRERYLLAELQLYNKLVGILLRLQRLLLAVLQANLGSGGYGAIGGLGSLGGYGLGSGDLSGLGLGDLSGLGFDGSGTDSLGAGSTNVYTTSLGSYGSGLGSGLGLDNSASRIIQRQLLAVRIINLVLQLLRRVIRVAGGSFSYGSGSGYSSDSVGYGDDGWTDVTGVDSSTDLSYTNSYDTYDSNTYDSNMGSVY